jgi:hypothetical protein
MTLVLTELSEAGIAMAADSAITISNTIRQWEKIIRVRRINAAVSYWGRIGLIAPGRFDHWLKDWIEHAVYSDLPSFAAALADHLNATCQGRTIREPAGIHVAGITCWARGPTPTFYHIHNGHTHIELISRNSASQNTVLVQTGSNTPTLAVFTAGTTIHVPTGISPMPNMPDFLRAAQFGNNQMEYRVNNDPRTLFRPYRDFPDDRLSPDENYNLLKKGFLTRNGDYAPFAIIAGTMDMARIGLNSLPGVSYPRNPNTIGARIVYLRLLMETVIKIYSNSTMGRGIGGPIRCLGIRNSGTYFEKTGWAPR